MTKMKLVNFRDLRMAEEGLLRSDQVRALELDALVDAGAVDLVLPADVVAKLGLPEIYRRTVRLADGSERELSKVAGLLIEVLGRRMGSDAYVVPEGAQALLGQIQLEDLDLIVDPRSREIRVNPRSPHMASGYAY